MSTPYLDRPFNLRYVIRHHEGQYTPELLRTHHTATASWLYIHRQFGVDDIGPTPDWSKRDDLILSGRCAPARADQLVLSGVGLWEQADLHAAEIRPDEPACAHAVGSLPWGKDVAGWRSLIEGFCEDNLVSQGMVADWAIHRRDASEDREEILPHVHFLITTRAYDPAHREVGHVRQAWLRTENMRKTITEKWWKRAGFAPRAYAVAA